MQRPGKRDFMTIFAAVLIAGSTAGCATGGAHSLADMKHEQIRSLTIRCYQENREAMLRSSAPELRLACREWARSRVDV